MGKKRLNVELSFQEKLYPALPNGNTSDLLMCGYQLFGKDHLVYGEKQI